MNQEFIIVPNTGEKIYDGTIVILQRLPGTKWIVHEGHYIYNNKKSYGWYLSAIPSGTTMPLFQSDLYMITIVGSKPHPHPPCPPGPCPPGPGPFPPPGPCPEVYPFTKEDKDQIREAMLTVDSLEDRDKLSSSDLQDGKVVRVNDFDGEVAYFEWSSESQTWLPLNFGSTIITKQEAYDTFATMESFNELEERVEVTEDFMFWRTLP